ncbi:MAG: 30S ribosomal protein S9 [Bacteroidota bacterium]
MSRIVKVGRRKRAVARVYLSPGSGGFEVNKRSLEVFFPFDLFRIKVKEPFTVLGLNPSEFDVKAILAGGGIKGQAEALRLGIARALVEMNEEYRPPLKRAGLLTRDARKVERKKYGLKKARKSEQFSKR